MSGDVNTCLKLKVDNFLKNNIKIRYVSKLPYFFLIFKAYTVLFFGNSGICLLLKYERMIYFFSFYAF